MAESLSYKCFWRHPVQFPIQRRVLSTTKGRAGRDTELTFLQGDLFHIELWHLSFNDLVSASLELPLTDFSNVFCSHTKYVFLHVTALQIFKDSNHVSFHRTCPLSQYKALTHHPWIPDTCPTSMKFTSVPITRWAGEQGLPMHEFPLPEKLISVLE